MQALFKLSLLLPAFLAVSAGVVRDARSEAHITASQPVGGPHGTKFDDAHVIGYDHKRISRISMTGGCEGSSPGRVTQLQLTYRDVRHEDHTDFVSHGTTHGEKNARGIWLNLDEYVTSVEMVTHKEDVGRFALSQWTRVGWIKFRTNQGKVFECGAIYEGEQVITLGEKDEALLYFSGSSGDSLDLLTAHWIPKADF